MFLIAILERIRFTCGSYQRIRQPLYRGWGERGREGDPLIVDKEPGINIVGLHKYKTGVLAVFQWTGPRERIQILCVDDNEYIILCTNKNL
jgi:hypothetical protein